MEEKMIERLYLNEDGLTWMCTRNHATVDPIYAPLNQLKNKSPNFKRRSYDDCY